MKVGISISLNTEYESMWINGIKLNALNLSKMLGQIEGLDVYILDTGTAVDDLTKVNWDYSKYKIAKFIDMENKLDLLFMIGSSLPTSRIKKIKESNPNIKIVKYQCGNSYVVDMERVLFDKASEGEKPSWDSGHDATWIIPQQEYQNLEYYKTIYRQNDSQVHIVPFVWDPEPLDDFDKLLTKAGKKTPKYTPKAQHKKKLSVMEPNLNVVKYSLIPIMIAEKIFRDLGEASFKQIFIGSGKKLITNKYYLDMIKHFDIVNSSDNKIKFVGRYPISTFLSSETDIVISHQWENPLNYAYLDAMYYGYPLVHNADMIKDGGYYYEGFNITKGAEQLKIALQDHDKNIEEYIEKNKPILNRYTSTNPELVDTYKKLIDNLFNPNKHELSYEYNWKTNLYK
jgi:hypothetical protein